MSRPTGARDRILTLGVAVCVEATTGGVVYEERLSPGPDQVYASPVMAEGRIYYLVRVGRAVVLAAAPRLEVLAENVLEGGRGEFLASRYGSAVIDAQEEKSKCGSNLASEYICISRRIL